MDLINMPGIFMHEPERNLIRNLSQLVENTFSMCNIVHIGIGWGGSLYYSRVGALDGRLYGIDLIGTDDIKGTPEQIAMLKLNVIKGDSREVYKNFNAPIHFLYIDGNHLYECLIEDIKNWASKVVPGGFVAFHDCKQCHWAPGVNKAIDEGLSPKLWEDMGIAAWSRYFRRIV